MTSANLQIVITGDSSSAKKAMQDLIGDADKMDSSFKRIRDTAAGVFGAQIFQQGLRQLKQGLVDSFNAAQETARVQTQLKAALESTNGAAGVTIGQLNQMSEAFQRTTRYTDEEVGRVQALMLTFTNIKDNIFPQTTQVILDMATALHEDLQSATIQVGKALQEPITGVTSLRRVGVQLNDDQEKLIKTLVASGQGMKAQQIILAELTKEFGGSAEAMSPFERKMDSINDFVDEAKESIGFGLIGALTEASDWFDEHGDDISRWIDKAQPALDFLEEYAGTKIGGVIGFFDNLVQGWERGIDFIDDLIHGRWESAWENGLAAVEHFAKAMLNLLVAAFGTLPNIMIDAVNSGINAINSVKIPKLNLPGVGNVIPGGGGGLGVPNIPNIPTQVFDLSSVTGAMEKLAETGEKASESNDKLATIGGKTAQSFSGAGAAADKLKTVVHQIADAFSKLTGGPTRELADKQLKLAELQVKIAEGEAKGYDMSKSNLQQQVDNIQKSIGVETTRTDLLKAQMTAANGGLLTDKERDRVARLLIDAEKTSTGQVQTFGQKLAGIFPDLDAFGPALVGILQQAQQQLQAPAPTPAYAEPFVNGDHAMGLRSVPFDGYIARLHKNERVQTASEAQNGAPSVIHVHLELDKREIGHAFVDLKAGGGLRGVA